jgi:hypothetical protein
LKYSVDTSAFLDCWRRYYPQDVFPQVWEKLDDFVRRGILLPSEEVLRELERKDDGMRDWATERKDMFLLTDDEIQRAVSDILSSHPKLIDERKNRSGADPFVIAVARVRGCSVLTGEKPSGSRKRPNIPDVCSALDVRWLGMVEFFREQGLTFR